MTSATALELLREAAEGFVKGEGRITLDLQRPLAVLTLDNADAKNAITGAMMVEAFFVTMAHVQDPTAWSIRPQRSDQQQRLMGVEGQVPIVDINAPFTGLTYQPLAPGVVDMRGLWKAYSVEIDGKSVPPIHIERIEQCGNRVIVTSSGIIHDMRCDGTYENGVNDISGRGAQPITVAAFFENGIHVLRPKGMDGFEVTRELDGNELIWRLGPLRVTRMRRID